VYGIWEDPFWWPGTQKSNDKYQLRTTNETWAKAAQFIDLSNDEALAWWIRLANITNDVQFA